MILISHGADVNGWSDTQSTPVRVACYENDLPMVKFLIDKGANIFLANTKGGTCLMNSIRCANLTRFLISKGANVNDTSILAISICPVSAAHHKGGTMILSLVGSTCL
jgi:ankyrin repeat protein